MTGAGIKEFFEAVEASRAEYEKFVLFIFCSSYSLASTRRP